MLLIINDLNRDITFINTVTTVTNVTVVMVIVCVMSHVTQCFPRAYAAL